ncbi:MAG: phytanoyl-CoA dioxygenase family protein, partial [Spirochaetales bacterium]|nr:phytanoyl-CoA dioxygenase family protein [Spirochaetales bacterium]
DIIKSFTSKPDDWTVKEGQTEALNAGAAVTRNGSRLTFQFEAGEEINYSDPSTLELRLRKYMWLHDEAPVLQKIYQCHARIQGIVASILGEQSELYQSMALVKPPKIGVDKPWHQDNAYFATKDPDGVLGTWIALDNSTVENGCMHFIPGGHKAGPLRHRHTHDCEIVEDRIHKADAIPVELPPGGIIFFHGNIPHFTPPNSSQTRRRALQYHYRRSSNVIISSEEYDAVFTEADGSPASCDAVRRIGF